MKSGKKNNIRTLVLVPNLDVLGGVSLHFIGLRDYWKSDVEYFEAFRFRKNIIASVIAFIYKYISFIIKLISFKPDNILVNVSLKRGFFSRNIYVRIAKIFKARIITFIHGWDDTSEWMLNHKKGKYLIDSSETVIVLASQFKEKLIASGCKSNIHLTTTKVDDKLVKDFNISAKNYNSKNILFLARIEAAKGIYIALDAIKALQKKDPEITLRVAGTGEELEKAQQYAKTNDIKAIFLGRLSGTPLIEEFSNAAIYILPTTHGEGMPTSVLESMAFGLPIITRPVGGTCDFFIDGKMGKLIESLDAQDYINALEEILYNPEKQKEISVYNYNYAKEKFYASKVAQELEKIFENA